MQKANKILIHEFRGISDMEYHPTLINLIVGPNNSGKTAIIDAIFIFYTKTLHSPNVRDDPFTNQPDLNVRLNSDFSCISINDKEVYLFKKLKDLEKIFQNDFKEIQSEIVNLLSYRYHEQGYPDENSNEYIQNVFENFEFFIIKWKEGFEINPYYLNRLESRENFRGFLSKYVSDNSHDKRSKFIRTEFDLNPQVIRKNKEEANFPVKKIGHSSKKSLGQISEEDLYFLEKFIQENELIAGLERLSRDEVIYHSDNGLVSLPLLAHGDGFIAMIVTISRLLKAKDGILIIEEPENHLHPRYIQVFADVLIRYSKRLNVQVFMATHSQELVERFISSSESEGETDLLSILRIARDDKDIIPIAFNTEKASHILNDLLLDIRGV